MESERDCFTFVLNGESRIVREIAPQTTLLDYVRSQGLTGAKEGCAEGECGACAVLALKACGSGSAWQSINSCLVPLPAVAGQEICTVESIATSGQLADVQRAMAERGGSQCGYCTPGFIVSMFAEHCRAAGGSSDPEALGGNLCRCTGYRPILDAMKSLGPPADTPLKRRLDRHAPAVKPFEYHSGDGRFSRPCDLAEALDLGVRDASAEFVAGNTDLGVMTNLRDRRYGHLISLDGISELREFRDTPQAVEIGAALSLTEVIESWEDAPTVFRAWVRLFASPLIRNRATLGGNLATASPIGDGAPLLLSLDAEVRIASQQGERNVPLDAFFRDYRKTALEKGEILRSIRIPKPWPSDARFYKVARRSVDDISTVAAGLVMRRDGFGRVLAARFAFGGVAPTPVRATEAEEAVTGTYGEEQDIARARAAMRRSLHPIGDHRGSAQYRMALAQSLLEKFCFEQLEQAAA